MIADRLERWNCCLSGPIWQCAFDFIAGLTPDAEEGYTHLQGDDLVARVMSYETKAPENAKLEAHRKFIDIQSTLVGAEGIEWFPIEGLEPVTPFDDVKDRAFYRRPGCAPAKVDVFPGTFVVLFPPDAHMPQLIVGGTAQVIKKVVVKINADLLDP